MEKHRLAILLILLVLFLGVNSESVTGQDSSPAAAKPVPAFPEAAYRAGSVQPVRASSGPTVALLAASGASISFQTQNGETVDGVPTQALEMPYLVLHRNGLLTDPSERTLIVQVSGITVPPPGVTVTLELKTQHGNPDPGSAADEPIVVWRESEWIGNPLGKPQTGVSASFRHEFGDFTTVGTETITTPTDYFQYSVSVIDQNYPMAQSLPNLRQDYAFLMEDQWIVQLPEVLQESPGAAPDELVVYYCDMFPFRKTTRDPTTWLPREGITGYIRDDLIPAMVEAFRVQSDGWGFMWYEEWTSYRSGVDAQRLSVALADGKTWFHGKAPLRGNAGISMNANGGGAVYDTLLDLLVGTFHHELFHNHQRNIQQHYGGSGAVSGQESAWDFFAEGTAVLASSVGQPDVEFNRSWGARTYLSNAGSFAGRAGISEGDLNKSYEQMNPYHTALYWRFLYEQCGGMANGLEDPARGYSGDAAGMGFIRQVLVSLYDNGIIDISTSTDLVGTLPALMDRALKDSPCPFQTYEGSLLAFARAIYALRLEAGRFTGVSGRVENGFYDPDNLYYDPSIDTITYRGTELIYEAVNQRYPAGIPSSFGMDFVDVMLDPSVDTRNLVVEFRRASGATSDFVVQVWRLFDPGDGSKPRLAADQGAAPTILDATNADGDLLYQIPDSGVAQYNELGLVVTRVDARESAEPDGVYSIVVRPGTQVAR